MKAEKIHKGLNTGTLGDFIPEEWRPVFQFMNIQSNESLASLNPNKLFNELCGANKKGKFGLTPPAREQVQAWVAEAGK